MVDFFNTIRSFFDENIFCDLEIVSYRFGEVEKLESVKCHSLVLTSAIPSLKPIVQSDVCDEPVTLVILLQDEVEELVSVRQTLAQVYDSLSGLINPDVDVWSSSLLGHWPTNESTFEVKNVPSLVVQNKRRRTASKRFINYDDVTDDEDHNASNFDVVEETIPSKRPYRKARKSNRGRKPSMKKKETADIKNVELLNDNDLDDGEDFMENFNKSIKEELNETNDGVVENEDDAFEENELLDDDIQVKAEKSEFMGDERDFDELCRTSYIPTKKEEKQDMSLQKLVATSRVASTRGNVTYKAPKTKTRRHLKRGQCPECLEIFPSANSTERRQFVVHKLSHFNCDCPNINFTSATAFRTHMTSVHSDKKNLSLSCSHGKCHALFFSQSALDHHVRLRHSNSLENGVGRICDECGQTFVNRHHLNIHTRHRHAQIKCPICNEICIGKLHYNKHREKAHTMPELCDYCGKSFPSKKFLRIHVINLHLGDSDRPNRCEMCGKGFLSKILLRDHIAVVHDHQKPYECRSGSCDRAFTTSACRRRHELRVHQLNIALKRGAVSKYVIPEGRKKPDEDLTA